MQQQRQDLEKTSQRLEADEAAIHQRLADADSMVRELVGVLRINARDLSALIDDNLKTALNPPDTSGLQGLSDQTVFPGMADIRKMIDLLFGQITTSGDVLLTPGTIVDRDGRKARAEILTIGGFSAAYRIGKEIGFLGYAPAEKQFYALSRLPSGRLQKEIRRYMAGESDAVPLDLSRGAALQQMAHQPDLWQQIRAGGPLIWPILAILGVATLMVIERVVFLLRRRLDGDGLLQRIADLAAKHNWQACRQAALGLGGKPLARVLTAGLDYCQAPLKAMEDALQEAILKEIPPMERYLAALGMLAAIAPLLGLLGTVTGMIDTFQVITRHGTGDPRLMSGGISVALVTTMLGLSVAIPIMLAHTLIGRAVDNRIGELEEKAVALVNIVHKSREQAPGER
ncbi:MotA/TolQ/ExbB proton channel family protein [Desulfosarcina cetonica]|uniref:MotA/TolQ/ExbB proton channel family protein n=1 Tax=Desulfosarcina cetonica TaxID=90730 RepID=UPI0006D22E16|nr:MotA/TolQ/ExbB proton channel family protein [Desulfosarcina cetonica]